MLQPPKIFTIPLETPCIFGKYPDTRFDENPPSSCTRTDRHDEFIQSINFSQTQQLITQNILMATCFDSTDLLGIVHTTTS